MEKELLALCEDFVKHHKVRAPESPYQMDGIQEAAPELIEAICNIVGYYDDDTDSLDRRNVATYDDNGDLRITRVR